jgi:membrane-associated phospholipid phosphatase
VTAQTLFRGFTPDDLIGPYISQFFYPTLAFGAGQIVQRYSTYAAGTDYLLTFQDYLNCQNGVGPFGSNQIDPTPRYLKDGRGIGAWVHIDVLFQAYFQACLYLLHIGAPLNPGNPYVTGPSSINQVGFGTFGAPHLKAIICEVASRALKAQWFQKWFVHRALRPEAFGGLVDLTASGRNPYPLHRDVLNSSAIAQVHSNNGNYLLPMAFPEGCPQHPSYGSGHATVAGACVTIIKAFFDENHVLPNPVVPSEDGTSLSPYTGSDAGLLTVRGESNKIASNVAFGRNIAGVHWRTDAEEAMKLGEAVAISILHDQKASYNEAFSGFTFTKFDGTKVTV